MISPLLAFMYIYFIYLSFKKYFWFQRYQLIPDHESMEKTNLIGLGFKLISEESTIEFLQDHEILPRTQKCSFCHSTLFTWKKDGGYHFFYCHDCQKKTSLRHGTCTSGANLSLRSFVILAYMVTSLHNLTYNQSKLLSNLCPNKYK